MAETLERHEFDARGTGSNLLRLGKRNVLVIAAMEQQSRPSGAPQQGHGREACNASVADALDVALIGALSGGPEPQASSEVSRYITEPVRTRQQH
jgi:hypothetical protein